MDTRLRIHLYSICWNEAAMLSFFFRHYDPWVSRYVFYDDGSTDGTLEILARHPRVEIRRFERRVADSYVKSAQLLQNEMWKESRGDADWVIITAVDEHLHHPHMPRYLERCHQAGVTLIPALGYQMVARRFPSPEVCLCQTLTRGAPFHEMNKLSLFRPDALEETGFGVGRHVAEPRGRVVYPRRDELLLLHYKYLAPDYTAARHALLATGLGSADREQSFGWQYLLDRQGLEESFAGFEARAVDIASPAHVPRRDHQEARWWRPPEGRMGRLLRWVRGG
jgi:hypothetical protein